MKITLSVIVVNYNGKKFLPRLFESIFRQSFNNFEVILVDNSSRDDSVKFTNRKCPKIRVFIKKNAGYGSACNFGALKAKGEYLVFINEDMYFPQDFLSSMYSFYQQIDDKTKIGGIGCKMVDFDKDPSKMPKKYGGQIDIFGFSINKFYKNDIFIISGSPFFISKSVFRQIKGFNESIFLYGEDVDLSWRLKILGYNNYMNHDTYLHHFGGGASGGFGPTKIAQNLCVSLIPMYTNYSVLTLIFILPFYCLYILLMSLALLIIKRNVRYLSEIFKLIYKFFHDYQKIHHLRMFVQENRVYSDSHIYKYVSLIPAFIFNSSYKKLSKNYKIVN